MKKTISKPSEPATPAPLAMPDSYADARQRLLLVLYNLGMREDDATAFTISASKAYLDFTLDLDEDVKEAGLTTEQALDLLRLHMAEKCE